MKGRLFQVRFYSELEEARNEASSRKFNGDTDYRLRVEDVNIDGTWTCSIEWSRLQAGPPKDQKDVPDAPFVLLRGGTIAQATAKLWDTEAQKVLLLLRVLGRA